MGSYGERRKEAKTRKRSQAGKTRGDRALCCSTALATSCKSGSSEKDGPPNCRRVVEVADRWALTVEAASFLSVERKAR